MSLAVLAQELPAQAAAPLWVELIPAGSTVVGFDGRRWANPGATAVIAATQATNRPLPVDWEHAMQIRGERGEEAPAAGWIEELAERAGAIWGRVAWTPRAANQVRDREYRFLSPVFQFERAEPNRIIRIVGVGLTNAPNLALTALNSMQVHASRDPTPAEMKVARIFNLDPRQLAQHNDRRS